MITTIFQHLVKVKPPKIVSEVMESNRFQIVFFAQFCVFEELIDHLSIISTLSMLTIFTFLLSILAFLLTFFLFFSNFRNLSFDCIEDVDLVTHLEVLLLLDLLQKRLLHLVEFQVELSEGFKLHCLPIGRLHQIKILSVLV